MCVWMISSGYITLLLRVRLGVVGFLGMEIFVQCSLRVFVLFRFLSSSTREAILHLTVFFWTQPVFTGVSRSLPGAYLQQYAG